MVAMRLQTMMAEMIEMGIDPMAEIRALGYEFREGKLCQLNGSGGFEFESASHYESLADAVSQYVPLLLEEEAHLRPVWLPQGSKPGEGCAIFVTEGYDKADKLLLMIQGIGRVRAGVWGCSLCINDSLEHGTMLSQIHMAVAAGYGVIVFNPNENMVDEKPVPGSETFSNHVAYVLDNYVSHCSATRIDILAHSHGGRALLSYLAKPCSPRSLTSLVDRLQHLVFTDSYHVQMQLAYLPRRVQTLIRDSRRCVNFVPDIAPLGTAVQEWNSQDYHFTEAERGCACISAGVLDHASTNYAARDAIFDFLHTAPETAGVLDHASTNYAAGDAIFDFLHTAPETGGTLKGWQSQISNRSESFDEFNAPIALLSTQYSRHQDSVHEWCGSSEIDACALANQSSKRSCKRKMAQVSRLMHYMKWAVNPRKVNAVVPYSSDHE